MFEGVHYRQEFLVVDLIVHFRGLELPGVECYQV